MKRVPVAHLKTSATTATATTTLSSSPILAVVNDEGQRKSVTDSELASSHHDQKSRTMSILRSALPASLRELRILMCQHSPQSAGARFITLLQLSKLLTEPTF